MSSQLRVAAFVCGLALAAGCAGPVSSYVLPAIGTPSDAAEQPAPIDVATLTGTTIPVDSMSPDTDDVMAGQP